MALDGSTVADPNARARRRRGDRAFASPRRRTPSPGRRRSRSTSSIEDDDVIVIDKPAGLVVHPGAGNRAGTLVNALIAHCGDSLSGIGGVKRPGIVHRLDKDTSGVLVVAKNDAAHRALSAQFADHGREGALLREYDALVWGVPKPHIGAVDAPLNRDPRKPPEAGRRPHWRPPRGDALRRQGALRRQSPRSFPAGWRPAEPTRSACIWRISAIRLWATSSTAAGF